MAAALPLTKLAGLLVKSLAKPVSKRIKHEFSRYKTTQNILVFIGQTNHQITSRMTIWSAGYKVRRITPLDSEKAMKAGSEFVGESFILVVSASIVVWEYNRSREKERAKTAESRAQAAAERAQLQAKLHALNVRLKALEATVEQQQQSSQSSILTSYVWPYQQQSAVLYQPPPERELVPIDEEDEAKEKEKKKQEQNDDDNTNKNQRNNIASSDDNTTPETVVGETTSKRVVWWDVRTWWR